MQRYRHRLFDIADDGHEIGQWPTVVSGKMNLRARLVRHFLEGGGPVAFELLDSPNRNRYRAYPYVNRLGRPEVCFTVLEPPSADPMEAWYPLVSIG